MFVVQVITTEPESSEKPAQSKFLRKSRGKVVGKWENHCGRLGIRKYWQLRLAATKKTVKPTKLKLEKLCKTEESWVFSN